MHKLWIDLEGNLIPVQDCHEEWANKQGCELEDLLAKGWVRVQSVPPQYLLIDFLFPLNAMQAVAVVQLFEDRFEQIVVEIGGEARSFVDGEKALNYAFNVGRPGQIRYDFRWRASSYSLHHHEPRLRAALAEGQVL
jgi:hypothetical protein